MTETSLALETEQESSPAMQQEIINIDSRLAKVHGPFSWGILNCIITDKAIISRRREQMYPIVNDGQDYFPELVLIYYLMQIVENVTNDDLQSALESLMAAETTLADIKDRATLKNVENVLQYIFEETKCHVFKKQGKLRKVVELLDKIIDVDNMNKTELAMLNGCHCTALSLYATSTEEGMEYAKKAIKYEPDNGKWHLWLARFYREKRRNKRSCQKFEHPNKKEASEFAKAYQLSPNEYTGVALAQLYRESNDIDKAGEMYKKIHALEPTSWKVRLQLALGFIQTNKCSLAKECLDYVAEKMPDTPTYNHYMAMFEEKCNHNHKAALQYYKRTTIQLNNAAEEQYMKCKIKVEPEWDPLPYLLDLPERYKGFACHVTQPMYIQIGLYYLYEHKHNVIAACQYLAKAISMNPNYKQLRNQSPLFHRVGRVNVYHILANEVKAALRDAAARYNEEEIGMLTHTLKLCHVNCHYIPHSAKSRAETSPALETEQEFSPVMQQEILNVDSRLAKVHGPFSWDVLNCVMTDKAIISRRRTMSSCVINDGKDYLPELVLISDLMQIVEDVTSDDLPSALESLTIAGKTLADIKKRATLKNVENVLQYIFEETKCHVFKKQGKLTKVVALLDKIIDVDNMNKTELAMLNGCHSSALSLYVTSTEEGIKYANKAIEYEPDNGKWHLWLARFYREKRRNQLSCQKFEQPDTKEASAFAKAYQLFPNEYTGVALAQLYRESNEIDKAGEIYKEIYAREPNSWKVRLQLALGFIRTNNCILAKECLDYVAEKKPFLITYHHYMAIFEEKCNHDLKTALRYYKNTTMALNQSAEDQYMKCKKKVEPDWDPLPYLLDLPKKYEGYACHVTQPMYIQIGLYYLYEKHDVIATCQYLAEAIKMNPDNKQLRSQFPLFHRVGRVNVYHILANEVEAALDNAAARYDEEEIRTLNDSFQLCRKNCKDLSLRSQSSMIQAQKSQARNGCRNYSRGSSRQVENTNWREEKPSTALRRFANYNPRSSGDVLDSPKRDFGSSYQRNYTSWRSEGRVTQGTQSNPHPPRTFRDEKDINVADRTRDGGDRGATCTRSLDKKSWLLPTWYKPNHQKEEEELDKKNGSEAETSCRLVKSVKDCRL